LGSPLVNPFFAMIQLFLIVVYSKMKISSSVMVKPIIAPSMMYASSE